jgi:Leucine-rich repeat (LRR) protein
LNGATCHPTIGDRFLCTCPPGFGGVNCEIECSGEIEFPDPALASAVRSAALLDDGEPITAEALTDVMSLSVYDTQLSDLTGIECMSSLSWVTMSEVGLTDLTPFAALPRLTSLRADCNSITDLSPIAGLINLVDFSVGKSSSCEVSGQVTDIGPLRDLVGLASLDLSGHDIDSLLPLAALTRLQWLILATNPRLASLAGLENASHMAYFVATDTLVSDIAVFAGHPTLQTLWLSGSNVSDLTPLLTASALEELYIRVTAVDCEEQAENIAVLQANGVTISSDCD